MKKFLLTLILVLSLTLPALSEPTDPISTDGTIAAYNASQGTISARFMPGAPLEMRDIYAVLRKGKPVGEAMIIKIDGDRATLLPKKMQGTPKMGDVLRFSRHVEIPLDGTEGWKVFNGPEFSVSFPTPPVGPKSATVPGDRGSTATITEWASADVGDQMAYVVGVEVFHLTKLGDNERWGDAEESLNHTLAALERSQNAKVNWSRRINQGKIPGREFEFSGAEGMVIRGRLFAVRATYYYAMAVARDKGVTSRSWKFLNSFKVTPKEQ